MLLRFMLLFVLTPLVELAILVYLGIIIGALYTILIVVATGVVGGVSVIGLVNDGCASDGSTVGAITV